jgi:predicted regulator of Ras-like GTPase activity (Roadblock/LC7/MglB family)
MVGSRAVDAADALRELTEISSQIEAAVLVTTDGTLLASTLADDGASRRLAAAAVAVVEEAGRLPRESEDGLVQLEAATPEGSLFVVLEADRAAAAVTKVQPTAGLVFFDLKSCLHAAAAADGDGKPRPVPRARRTKKTAGGDVDESAS